MSSETKVITINDIIGEAEETPTENPLPSGMREIKLEDIEAKKKINYIENPLPVPKRREHKEMSYAIEELPSDKSDYDILDMTGMDFFDIE